jgi:hypothetical protein
MAQMLPLIFATQMVLPATSNSLASPEVGSSEAAAILMKVINSIQIPSQFRVEKNRCQSELGVLPTEGKMLHPRGRSCDPLGFAK